MCRVTHLQTFYGVIHVSFYTLPSNVINARIFFVCALQAHEAQKKHEGEYAHGNRFTTQKVEGGEISTLYKNSKEWNLDIRPTSIIQTKIHIQDPKSQKCSTCQKDL